MTVVDIALVALSVGVALLLAALVVLGRKPQRQRRPNRGQSRQNNRRNRVK